MKILLVNPISSAGYMSEIFKIHNIDTTAIYTINEEQFTSFHKPNSVWFNKQIKLISTNFDEIINELGNLSFDYVISGTESATELADKLANYYTPQYANDSHTYINRVDKYTMHKCLESAKLEYINQVIYDLNGQEKINNLVINYPCFVKPLGGASSAGASKIETHIELVSYFEQDFSVINMQNKIYTTKENANKFLIAEFIDGEEFLVDAFSVDGKHYISSIQKYKRIQINGSPVIQSFNILPNGIIYNQISNYIMKCLDATGFNNGFSHSELFLTKDNKLKLIEINPRISGGRGVHNKLATIANLPTQVELLMKYIFGINIQYINTETYAMCVALFNFGGGKLDGLSKKLAQFKIVTEIIQLVNDGHTQLSTNPTITDVIAFVICKSKSQAELEYKTSLILAQDKIGW